MFHPTRGVSTIECLIALVVFTIGALGSVGTVALGLRTAAEGAAAASSARLAAGVLDSLRAEVESGGKQCSVVSAGSSHGPHQVESRWQLTALPGGQQVELLVHYRAARGDHVDTLRDFLPCR